MFVTEGGSVLLFRSAMNVDYYGTFTNEFRGWPIKKSRDSAFVETSPVDYFRQRELLNINIVRDTLGPQLSLTGAEIDSIDIVRTTRRFEVEGQICGVRMPLQVRDNT